ncbi:MAG TPA: LysM peptidoglycan-binding domain-containing protein [Allosphingosinicella sp.]|nr:LysM peptidoglycan-binding domain-containing protein [Allosphingosinicella sp.]
MTSTTIEALWAALQASYYNAGTKQLALPAVNTLDAPAIAALLGDGGLFPAKALAMSVDKVTPPGTTIVLNGSLGGAFLGLPAATPAIATFTIGAGGEPQLAVAVSPAAGKALHLAFPGLDEESPPAAQDFTSATFTAASSATLPTLQFSGVPDLSETDYAKLWSGPAPTIQGAITAWTGVPAFSLTTGFVDARAQAGLEPMQAQLTFQSPGTTDATGQIDARILNTDPTLQGLILTQPLPLDAGRAVIFDTGKISVPLTSLGPVASLFMGQQLAALIPTQFSLGQSLFLSDLQLDLTDGGDGLQGVQLSVDTGNKVQFPLLPFGLLTLTGIGATFGWFGGTDVNITFSGDFLLGGKNPQLGFTAAFSLADKLLTVRNTTQPDVGQLLTIFKMEPPNTGMTIETVSGTVSIPNQTWRFECDVTVTDWSIELMGGTKVGLDAVGLTLAQSSASLDVTFSATATLFDSPFDILASYDTGSKVWNFAGHLVKPLKLARVTKALLPFDFTPPDITLEKFDLLFSSAGDMFMLDTVVDWTIADLGTKITAELQLQKRGGGYQGFVAGVIDVHGLVLTARYDFSPTSTGLSFAYRNLTVTYRKDGQVPTVTVSLGRGTVGDLFAFFLSFAEPGRTLSLGEPWSAFEKIELPAITVSVNLTTKAVRVELDQVANLGFLDLEKIVVNYSRPYGSARIELELTGSFLGQPYGTGGAPPLKWDALNDPPPAVPGAGSKAFDLEFLGLGQHVAVTGKVPTEMDKVIDALEAAMRPPADPNQNPIVQGGALAYDAGSNWLIGTRFTIASTLRMDLIFNDPVLYGLLIQMSGEKAGIFAGLRFEILYRKVTDTIGVYHIELTLPDVMRHLEFGAVSITLPIITIDIYTNGNFRVDFGFPPSLTDFSRSFSIQVFPFTGFGGFYFAVLNGQTSSNVPKVVGGHFGTVLEFGFALQIGVGKTLSLGILSGGITITVGGELQGVLGWYAPDDSNLPSARYHHLIGTVALVGKVWASVDFGILQASVTLTVYASITLDMESYKALLIEVSAGVSVAVSIKILFIRINFSFNATITERFSIGSDSVPPWQLAPPGGSGSGSGLRARRAYLAAPLLTRQPWHNQLRRRPARRLVMPLRAAALSSAAGTITVPVSVTPLVTQALSADFGFQGGPTVPPGTTTPVLALLLTLPTSDDPASGTNQLMRALLQQMIVAIGAESATVSAAVIDEILHTLSDADACDTYFTYGDIVALFTAAGIEFALAPRTTQAGSAVTPSAVLAMIPELSLATPDFSIDFGADRKVDAGYEAAIRSYFAKLTPGFAAGGGGATNIAAAAPESMATFLFRYQFFLLAKSAVDAARDLLASSKLTIPAAGPALTLAAAANLYNNDYIAPAAASFDAIAALFGVTGPQLAAANPDLPAGGPQAGDAVFVPATAITYTSQPNDTLAGLAAAFGVAPAALQSANPGVGFPPAAGTRLAIPAMRILHTVLAGETAAAIAAEFAVDLTMLAAANPGVDLNALAAGTMLLIPRRLTALGVAAANQPVPGLLDTSVPLTLTDIHLLAAADATPTSVARAFGISIAQLLADNGESTALFAPGQQIALGNLATATRSDDSLDGLAAYWYGSSGITLDALSAANPGLTLVEGQALAIPQGGANDQPYSVPKDATFSTVLDAWPGLTLAALISNNPPIRLNLGQPVTLPGVVCPVSASFELAYTAAAGDTYDTIAQAYFASDQAAAAAALLAQLNGSAEPAAGARLLIPYATSPANILRQYKITMAELAATPAVGDAASKILAARAPIAISTTSHIPTAGESLGDIAQAFDLSLEQLIAQIGTVAPLARDAILTIAAIPGMPVGLLCDRLAAAGKFTNALSLTSRFLLGGLRVPAPTFVAGTAAAPEPTFPLYALVGQEFPVNPAPPVGYAITLTAPAVDWLALPGGTLSFPLDADEIARITAFATLAFDPGIPAGAAQALVQFTTVPDRQPPAALSWWQTPDLPVPPPASAKVVQPSLWMIPAALGDALAGSATGMLAYAGMIGTVAADGTMNAAPLAASRYATILDLTVEKVPGSAPGVYTIVGTDQAGLQRLIALWEHLDKVGATADISLAYASQAATAAGGTLVSDALDRAASAIVKTNLSTETHAPPLLAAHASAPVRNTAPAQASIAHLNAAESLDVLQFLWECSAVRSGGFYLRYVLASGEAGLPEGLFKDGNAAQLKLIVAGSDLAANLPVAMAFNNALIVADNVDPAHDKLFFEALTWIAGPADSLTTAAQAIAALHPGLPGLPDWLALARINQLVPGTMVPGTAYSGQTATPDDSFRSLALRAGSTVDALAAAIQTTPCLQPLARFELMGEPVEQVPAGASLVSIAQEHSFLDPASLAALNAATANLLAPGQTIAIPGQPSRPIVAGESFGSIAQAAAVPVTLLGTVNANAPILVEGADIVVAADTLRTVATLPPGHSGFTLQHPAPDENATDPPTVLARLYHMLGFALAGTAAFEPSGQGLPATPANQAGETDDGIWRYRQVMAIAPSATLPPPALPATLPAAAGDPYAGIAAGATVAMQLTLQDVLGNWTQGSVLSGPDGATLAAPVGYTDEIVPLAGWPSLSAAYRFAANGPLKVALSFAPDKFLPDASAAPMPQGVPVPAQGGAVERAQQAQAQYAKVIYQLLQADVECALSTSLGPVADAQEAADSTLALLRAAAGAAAVFLGAAQGMAQTTAGSRQGFATLAALVTAQTATAGAGYPVSWADLASANSLALAGALFAADTLAIPQFLTTRAGETPAAFEARANVRDPAGFARDNADVPTATGVAIATAERPVKPDYAAYSLAAMAEAMNCPLLDAGPVVGLATANAGATLTQGTVLTYQQASFTAGMADTLTSAAAALTAQLGLKDPLSAQDVAAANRYVPQILARTLPVVSALTVEGDTLAHLAATYGSAVPDLLALNANTPGLWAASTALLVGSANHSISADDTLASIAAAAAVDPAMILSYNAQAQLASSAELAIPWSADGTIAVGTYAAAPDEPLSGVVARFAGWTLPALVEGNLNWPGLFAPRSLTLDGHTVTPDAGSTFASLAAAFSLAPADFAQQIAGTAGAIRAGAVFIAPAAVAQAGETLDALAKRYGLDAATVAGANAALPGLLEPGQVFTVEGTQATVLANDTVAMIAARLNAARVLAKLPPLGIGEIGAAAGGSKVQARNILPAPPTTMLTATVTPTTGAPIVNLAVDLAISRNPELVAPAFRAAPLVVSANCAIVAAPFASGAGQAQSLAQFAADFEAAFAGLKLATGPQHTHFAPVLAKASLRATAGGGTGAAPSGSVRPLWVVDFSTNGIDYGIDAATPRFYALEPLSTVPFSTDGVSVPTYSSDTGIGPAVPMNFRGADPEQWNLAFLEAIDLVLSAPYAAAAASVPALASQLESIVSAKLDIAKGLTTLVAAVGHDSSAGLKASQDAMTQQLLVSLTSAYTVQSLVQFDVTATGAGVGKISPAPRLAGKLTATVLTAPPDDGPVAFGTPFAALAISARVSAAAIVAAIFDVPGLVLPGVVTHYPGHPSYTTVAGDTVGRIADIYEADAAQLAAGLTLDPDGEALLRGGVPTNLSTVTVPEGLATVSAAAAWLPATVAELLVANADRTDFFAAGSQITVGSKSATQGPNDSLSAIAANFGGLDSLARDLVAIDAATADGSYTLNPTAPPRALQHVPQFSFQSSKVSLEDGATLTSMLTVNRPADQRKLILDLDFKPTQLEFDIYGIVGVAGYEGSSWLSFVLPLDPAPNAVGQIAIPIALRGYPEPAVISDQQALPPAAGGDPDSTLTQWDYRFKAQRPFAAQDQMTLEISFNDDAPSARFHAGSTDRTPVIEALAGFAAIWPAVSKDLAALPQLLGGGTPDELKAATRAVAALAQLAGTVQGAWGSLTAAELASAAVPRAFQYRLATLNAADGRVDALILDRLGQAIDFSIPPDDFLFLSPAGLAPSSPVVPAGLADLFASHGFPLSGAAKAQPRPGVAGDWLVVDPGDSVIAPQTYRLLPPPAAGPAMQVWRQLTWPALTLGATSAAAPLTATQAGTQLTYAIPPGQEISEGAPLDLTFDFCRLDAFTLTNGWGGFSIARNANLVDGINPGFVYETPPTRFPTRITPFLQRADPVALAGTTLEGAIETLFEKLFAGQAALQPQATTRNIRVQAAYWRMPDGTSPVGNPLAQRIPLLLVPIYPFEVSSVGASPIPFCQQLASTMQSAADNLGVDRGPDDCWLIDLLIYGEGGGGHQPLLAIENHYFPVDPKI